jgi:protein-disulfide reductase (glutathione)
MDADPMPARTAKTQPATAPALVPDPPAPPNGFPEAIAWWGLEDALATVKTEHRPMMLIVHASWCERCKELKPRMAADDVVALSQQFVMVNVDQDEVPAALGYAPDGTYVPRVLFFDPATGQLDAELVNATRDRYRYFYGPNDDLAAIMKGALARYERS